MLPRVCKKGGQLWIMKVADKREQAVQRFFAEKMRITGIEISLKEKKDELTGMILSGL